MNWEETVGKQLTTHEGKINTNDYLKDKTHVLLYFSADYCQPCKEFTPKLIALYEAKQDEIGIILVSSDVKEDAFNKNYGKMPWPAIPFEEVNVKKILRDNYSISYIPQLLVLNKRTGKLITQHGKFRLENDLKGEAFPWPDPTLLDMLPEKLIENGKEVEKKSILQGVEAIALYFGSGHFPPCKAFHPKLREVNESVNEKNKRMLTVFVSFDKTKEDFEETTKTIPGVAIPFEETFAKEQLKVYLEIKGVPSLIILKNTGSIINREGRNAIMKDPKGAQFPWVPQPLMDLDPTTMPYVNKSALCVILGDQINDRAYNELIDEIKPIISQFVENFPSKNAQPVYFAATHKDPSPPFLQRVRGFLQLKPENNRLQIAITTGKTRYDYPLPFSGPSFEKFVQRYLDGALKPDFSAA